MLLKQIAAGLTIHFNPELQDRLSDEIGYTYPTRWYTTQARATQIWVCTWALTEQPMMEESAGIHNNHTSLWQCWPVLIIPELHRCIYDLPRGIQSSFPRLFFTKWIDSRYQSHTNTLYNFNHFHVGPYTVQRSPVPWRMRLNRLRCPLLPLTTTTLP